MTVAYNDKFRDLQQFGMGIPEKHAEFHSVMLLFCYEWLVVDILVHFEPCLERAIESRIHTFKVDLLSWLPCGS